MRPLCTLLSYVWNLNDKKSKLGRIFESSLTVVVDTLIGWTLIAPVFRNKFKVKNETGSNQLRIKKV